MNILVLGSQQEYEALVEKNKGDGNDYTYCEDGFLYYLRSRNFQKVIFIKGFENEYHNLSYVYQNIYPYIRGQDADATLLIKLIDIEKKVKGFREEILKDLLT